ncbi:MAG: sensor histidine kinase [Pontibacterium sp.]
MLVLCAVVYSSASLYGDRAARITHDRQLLSAALQMAEGINLVDGQIEIDLPLAAFEILSLSPFDRAFYSVRAATGDLLTGYTDLPTPANPPILLNSAPVQSNNYVFYDETYRQESVRFIAVQKRLLDRDYDSFVTLIIGNTQVASRQQAEEAKAFVARFVFAFFVLSIFLIVMGVWLALRPLKAISMALQRRSSVDLSPLTLEAPREVAPLILAINEHMAQLSSTLERLKHFSSEAAHQLRTPLAGLRSEAQSALEETDQTLQREQLENIVLCSDRLADMLSYMLSRAELTHRYQSEASVMVNAETLISEVCRELVPAALDHDIEVALEVTGEEFALMGNHYALRFLASNLIENAIKYSKPMGVVSVQLVGTVQSITLVVKDTGIGISDEDKEHVFDYLYRSQNAQAPGTGIGLTVCKEVVDFHNGSLVLEDNSPSGVVITVIIPK